MSRTHHRRAIVLLRRARRRQGTVLVAALVCLLIVVAMLGTMLQVAVQAQRRLHVERDRRQCDLLLQAGIERAAFHLARHADYRGETWTLPASAVIGAAEGQVTIKASRTTGDQPWQVSVTAEYPLGEESSIRRSRSVVLDLKRNQSQE